MTNCIFDKYKNLSVVIKASLWFMFCTVLQKCLAFITTPIFIRIMDQEQYGYYSTYLSITTIFTVILTLNFDTCAYINGLSKLKTEAEKDELGTSLLFFTAIITIAFGVISSLFSNQLSILFSLPRPLFFLMSIEILFIPPVKFWMVKQRFAYKYIAVVSVTIAMLIINISLGIFFVTRSESNQAVLRVLSIALVQLCVGVFLYFCFIKKSGFRCITKYWKYGLKVNLPLIPHGLSIVVLSSSDKVMINSLVGAVQAGIYGVAYSVGLIINSIKLSLVDALKPWIYGKLKRREFGEISRICNVVFIINILLTFIVVGLGPEIIKIIAKPEYYEAIYIIPPVAASSYFTFIYNICSIVELYYEKNRNIMIASILSALINVILNLIFIPIYGYIAAGYTTLISFIILSILHFAFLNSIRIKEMEGIHILNGKSMLLLSLAVLFGMIFFTILYSYTVIRFGVVILLTTMCFFNRKRFISTIRLIKNK